jgi:hypothetical protein
VRANLSERVVRPGLQVMKLDTGNERMLFDPKTWSKKKREDRQATIDYMRRIGRTSMVQVGEDEYRMPNRAERRRAGIRGRRRAGAT